MVSNEKLTEKWKLRGLKLRGFRRNQISTPGIQRPRIWVPPTEVQKLIINFKIGIPGNWMKLLNHFRFLKLKERKEVMPNPNPGIQPTHYL